MWKLTISHGRDWLFNGISTHQSVSAVLHSGDFITSGSFRAEFFQPSLTVSGQLRISFSFVSSNSSIHISCRICSGSIHTSESSCTLFDNRFMTLYHFQHVGRLSNSLVSVKHSLIYSLGHMLGCHVIALPSTKPSVM